MKKGTLQKKDYLSGGLWLKLSFYFFLLWISNQGHASLLKVEAFLARAEYEQARALIDEMLKRSNLQQSDRAVLYWQKAICHISENQILKAKASFLKLFAINPSFKAPSDTSPKILEIYNEAFNGFKVPGALEERFQFDFIPIERRVAGEPIIFRLSFGNNASAQKISRLELHVRRLGNAEFSSLDFVRKKGSDIVFEATLPPVLTKRTASETTFEYFVDFLSHTGARLGGIAKRDLPLTFQVVADDPPSSTTAENTNKKGFLKAAIWISVATVIVGGALAAALVFSTPEEGSLRVTLFPAE